LNIALHFNTDGIYKRYGRVPYFLPVLEGIFRTLLGSESSKVHTKIYTGDLLVSEYPQFLKDSETKYNFLQGILGTQFSIWREVRQNFAETIFSSEVCVVALEGVNSYIRSLLIDTFRNEDYFLGAIQIYGANQIHWALYNQLLIPQYRYINGELRIFYSELDGDELDFPLEKHWKERLLFKSVTWEDLGVRHSVFDKYTSYKHAKRLAELGDLLSDHLLQLADDILLRTGDINASLQEELYAGFDRFKLSQTPSDIAQVALSCRRFIETLADTLYSSFKDNEPLVSKDGKPYSFNPYMEKLKRYIKYKKSSSKTETQFLISGLEDLERRIRKVNDLVNKGVHEKMSISLLDMDRLLVAMVTVTYDLLSLDAPPIKLPIETHLR